MGGLRTRIAMVWDEGVAWYLDAHVNPPFLQLNLALISLSGHGGIHLFNAELHGRRSYMSIWFLSRGLHRSRVGRNVIQGRFHLPSLFSPPLNIFLLGWASSQRQ